MMTDKEIESKYTRGTIVNLDGVDYRVKGYARYWKHWENGEPVQYDICLYLMPQKEYETLPQFTNPEADVYLPTTLKLHYFNFAC